MEIDKDKRLELFNILDKFKNDIDEEVSEQAYDSEIKAFKNKDLSEDDYCDRIEHEKKEQQFELELEKREMRELLDEEQKRKQEEEHKYEIYKLL